FDPKITTTTQDLNKKIDPKITTTVHDLNKKIDPKVTTTVHDLKKIDLVPKYIPTKTYSKPYQPYSGKWGGWWCGGWHGWCGWGWCHHWCHPCPPPCFGWFGCYTVIVDQTVVMPPVDVVPPGPVGGEVITGGNPGPDNVTPDAKLQITRFLK